MKIPKNAKLIIYVQKQELKAYFEYANKRDITLNDVSSINTVLRDTYEKEGKSFADLIHDGRIVINSGKVWEQYWLLDNKYFAKVGKDNKKTVKPVVKSDPVVEPVEPLVDHEKVEDSKEVAIPESEISELPSKKDVTDPVDGDELSEEEYDDIEEDESTLEDTSDDKDETIVDTKSKTSRDKKKKKVSLRTIGKWSLLGVTGAVVTYLGVCGISYLLSKKDEAKKEGKSGSDTKVEAIINENGNVIETTYDLPSDEELVAMYGDIPETVMEEVESNNEEVLADEPVQTVDYSSGSSVLYDDMVVQLNTIDNAAVNRQPFQFENLVVADDYDAIYALNSMRNKALTGQISDYQYMDKLVSYVFNNDNYVDGNFVEDFNSLHPYAQYIVVRMSQGQLLACRDYNGQGYNFNYLVDQCNIYGSDLYQELINKTNRK